MTDRSGIRTRLISNPTATSAYQTKESKPLLCSTINQALRLRKGKRIRMGTVLMFLYCISQIRAVVLWVWLRGIEEAPFVGKVGSMRYTRSTGSRLGFASSLACWVERCVGTGSPASKLVTVSPTRPLRPVTRNWAREVTNPKYGCALMPVSLTIVVWLLWTLIICATSVFQNADYFEKSGLLKCPSVGKGPFNSDVRRTQTFR